MGDMMQLLTDWQFFSYTSKCANNRRATFIHGCSFFVDISKAQL